VRCSSHSRRVCVKRTPPTFSEFGVHTVSKPPLFFSGVFCSMTWPPESSASQRSTSSGRRAPNRTVGAGAAAGGAPAPPAVVGGCGFPRGVGRAGGSWGCRVGRGCPGGGDAEPRRRRPQNPTPRDGRGGPIRSQIVLCAAEGAPGTRLLFWSRLETQSGGPLSFLCSSFCCGGRVLGGGGEAAALRCSFFFPRGSVPAPPPLSRAASLPAPHVHVPPPGGSHCASVLSWGVPRSGPYRL
jgi:hypothetical protein